MATGNSELSRASVPEGALQLRVVMKGPSATSKTTARWDLAGCWVRVACPRGPGRSAADTADECAVLLSTKAEEAALPEDRDGSL